MKNVFFINSPFQLLCSIEAIFEFNLINNILVIFNKGTGQTYNQIVYILNNHYSEFEKVEFIEGDLKSIKGWLKRFKTANKLIEKYQTSNYLFIGDYRDGIVRHISNSISSKQIFLLDDGFATIYIYNKFKNNKVLYNKKDKLKYLLSKGQYNYKYYNEISYFTIFDNYLDVKYVYRNNFDHFLSENAWIDKNVVYWLGSPIVEDGIVNENYYLNVIELWAGKIGNKKIYYFPHRRENSDKLMKISENFNIQIKETTVPIELYVIDTKIRPLAIISFFSTALFSLNRILDYGKIYYIDIEDKELLKRYEHIKNIYKILEEEIKGIKEIKI